MDFIPKRYFTPEQANRTLPLVRRIVDDIGMVYARLVNHAELLQRIDADRGGLDASHIDELESVCVQIEDEKAQLVALNAELEQLGALLKGPAEGLVDFPALLNGRIVFLCWKQGEAAVDHWHELEAGFRGRQSIEGVSFEEVPTPKLEPSERH